MVSLGFVSVCCRVRSEEEHIEQGGKDARDWTSQKVFNSRKKTQSFLMNKRIISKPHHSLALQDNSIDMPVFSHCISQWYGTISLSTAQFKNTRSGHDIPEIEELQTMVHLPCYASSFILCLWRFFEEIRCETVGFWRRFCHDKLIKGMQYRIFNKG